MDQILILDGGMGTTLEDEFHADVSTALWSSALLSTPDGQDTLRNLHTKFMESGADLVETCTYQSSYEGFEREGRSREEATSLMREAVNIAKNAITCNSCPAQKRLVLSLSCYGAIITPASQEYTGDYPPPYGPVSLSTSTKSLEQWHYQRLLAFASDAATWSVVDYIAFETVPLLLEARAIKRAMYRVKEYLHETKVSTHWPEWWISFVFPEGKLPGQDGQAKDIVETVFAAEDGALTPSGIGINCTKLRYLSKITETFTTGLSQTDRVDSAKPTLVLYPDGGLTYDTTTKTWHSKDDSLHPEQVWAEQLNRIAVEALRNGACPWRKVILGGCCKAGPSYIAALATLCKK